MRVLAVVLTSVVALSACGSTKPGTAANIGGTTITMSEVDDVVEALCLVGDSSPELVLAEQRREAVSMLALEALAAAEVERLDLQIPQSAVQITAAEERELEATYGEDVDPVLDLLAVRRSLFAVADELGAREAGQTSLEGLPDAERQAIRNLGIEILVGQLSEVDVDLDPRIGLSVDGSDVSATGSLSAGGSSDTAFVPATQRCG